MALGALLSSRRIWLLISLVNNLALLLFFKYGHFAVENLNAVFAWLHCRLKLPDPSTLMPFGFSYVLPVGISFFTFQSLSYTIDFYLGNVERERNFFRFATFVCFFPQLMAGPIERARHLLPQLRQFPPIRLQNFTDGVSLFLVGLFKKLALANYLAFYVERVYDNPEGFRRAGAAAGHLRVRLADLFRLQRLHGHGAGRRASDGVQLDFELQQPLPRHGPGRVLDTLAHQPFHMVPGLRLYSVRRQPGRRFQHLPQSVHDLLAFRHLARGGLDVRHLGGLHALGVMVTRELERSAFYREQVPQLVKQLGVFMFVCFAWIFFRADSLDDARLIVARIFMAAWSDPQIPALMLALVGLVWVYQFLYESKCRDILQTSFVRVGTAVFMVLYLFLFSSGGGAFIYFQF